MHGAKPRGLARDLGSESRRLRAKERAAGSSTRQGGAAITFDPILGDPTFREAALDNDVKGSVFPNRARYVREQFGAEAWKRLHAELSPAARQLFEQPPLPSTWLPIGLLVEIDSAIIRGPLAGDPSRMQRLAVVNAEYDLSAVYRFLLRMGSPAFVMRRIGVAFGAKVRRGQLREDHAEAGGSTLALRDAVLPYYHCAYLMPGWAQTALQHTGARAITVDKVACRHRGAAVCRWTVRWK